MRNLVLNTSLHFFKYIQNKNKVLLKIELYTKFSTKDYIRNSIF